MKKQKYDSATVGWLIVLEAVTDQHSVDFFQFFIQYQLLKIFLFHIY